MQTKEKNCDDGKARVLKAVDIKSGRGKAFTEAVFFQAGL